MLQSVGDNCGRGSRLQSKKPARTSCILSCATATLLGATNLGNGLGSTPIAGEQILTFRLGGKPFRTWSTANVEWPEMVRGAMRQDSTG